MDRDQIFSELVEIISNQDQRNHFISLLGEGGVGKTSILKRLKDYLENENPEGDHYLVVIYDYRDLMAQSIAGTILFVMQAIQSRFPGILQPEVLNEYTRMILETPDDMENILNAAKIDFSLLNNITRIVLLEDTLEVINYPSPYIDHIFQIGAYLPNCVAITAGRPEDTARGNLERINQILQANGWITHDFEVQPFTISETFEYLNRNVHFPDGMENDKEKTFLLTGGSPILLDITVDLLKQRIHPDIFNLSLEEIRDRLKNDPENIQREFRQELLERIRELNTPLKWAILYMSYLNRRYDKRILQILLGNVDIEGLEAQIKKKIYLRKSMLPSRGAKELLHDEMQRLVRDYLWDEIDHLGTMRKEIARKIIKEYYLPEIKKIKAKTLELENRESNLNNFLEYWNSEVHLAELQNECLDYALRVNPSDGYRYFIHLAKEAKTRKHSAFVRRLLHDGIRNLRLIDIPDPELETIIWK